MIPLIGLKFNAKNNTSLSLQTKCNTCSVRFIQKHTKLILTTDYPGLGVTGQEVVVKKGFGKNYLVPTQKAVFWTPEQRESIPPPTVELQKYSKKLG
jgi:hypothetical protein